MKGSIISIFVILALILSIPVLFLLSQESQTLNSKKQEPTPTPLKMTFENGEGIISGYVYHDNNRDGKRESEEKPFPSVKMEMKILTDNVQEGQKVFDTATDTYGYFTFRFPSNAADSYMVKIIVPKNYQTIDANPVIISDLTPNTEKLVEFGLETSGNITPTPTKKPKATPTNTEASPTP